MARRAPAVPNVVTEATRMTLRKRYAAAASDREDILDEARLCSALTDPAILPPIDQHPGTKLPESYQSVGSRGAVNLEGRMFLGLYPPGHPWLHRRLAPEIKHSGAYSPEQLQQIEHRLFLQELLIMSKLESAATRTVRGRRLGFASRKRQAISTFIVTGDALQWFRDDYRIKVLKRTQYVTKRDSEGDVLYHGVEEKIDPLTLSDAQIGRAGLNKDDLEGQDVEKRMCSIFTFCERQPRSNSWVIRQEINDHQINESEEPVTPFISTPFRLAPGEDYGRGFIALNLGDLRSLNELSEKLLDFAGMASKMHPVLDPSSELRDEDLAKPTGTVLHDRVVDGRAAGVAFLQVDKVADFRVVRETADAIERRLGAAMLLFSESTPNRERVNQFEISKIVEELEQSLGGSYSQIADDELIGTAERCIYQLERDGLLTKLPEGSTRIETVTGIAALSKQLSANRVLNLASVVRDLGDEAIAKVDKGVLVDVLARYNRVDEPGLIKSNEQVARERQEALALQAQAQASEKAIDVVGNAAEAALTPAA